MSNYKQPKFTFLKFFLLGLIVLWGCQKCHAQNPPQKINSYYEFTGVIGDSANQIPRVQPSSFYRTIGSLWFNVSDSSINVWTGTEWLKILANNGLSMVGGVVVTGNAIGASGSPSKLLSNRSVPTNGFKLQYLDSLENSTTKSSVRIWDTSGLVQGTNGRTPLKIIQNNPNGLFQFWQPYNYNVTYNSFYRPGTGNMTTPGISIGYTSAESDDAMPDNVYQLFGYNQTASANRADTSEAAARVAFETNFLGSIGGVGLDFEYHDPEITTFGGTIFRTDSKYISKLSGFCMEQSWVDDHQYYSIHDNFLYAQFVAANAGQHGQLNMFGKEGDGVYGDINFNSDLGSVVNIGAFDGGSFGISVTGPGQQNSLFIAHGDGSTHLNNSSSIDPATWGNTLIGTDSAGTLTATPSAQLELISVHRGFLKPTMTTIQRLAIASPAEGLEVYDLTLHHPFYFNGIIWVQQ